MRKGPHDAALLLYPVRESNASLILRRDSFYPSELSNLFRIYRAQTLNLAIFA